MLNIDRRNNITINAGDNAIIDVCLCGCDQLNEGDLVIFRYPEGEVRVTDFNNGVAKVFIPDNYFASEGTYCMFIEKLDGRKGQIASGKFIRKGGC